MHGVPAGMMKRKMKKPIATLGALALVFSLSLGSVTAFASTLSGLGTYKALQSYTSSTASTSWFADTEDQTSYSILKGNSFTTWLSGSKSDSDLMAKSVYLPDRYSKYISVTLDKSTGKFTVTGLAAGTASFVVYSNESVVYITVTVSEVHTVFLAVTLTEYPNDSTSDNLILNVGEVSLLKATLSPSNSTDAVVWNSSDKSIATVSSSGVVTAVSEGTATISATSNGKTAKCKVTVQ